MKKKIITICLAAIVTVMAIAGASLAYFTDTDKANNTFTVGNVDIELIENFGDWDPETPEKLLPAVIKETGDDGETVIENAVTKEVYVKNQGSEKAYVRVHIAVPSVLAENEHFVIGWTSDTNWSISETTYETTVDDIEYTVYVCTYGLEMKAPWKEAGATYYSYDYTTAAMDYVYLDSDTTNEDVATLVNSLGDNWHILVVAEGCQTAGFASAAEALTTAFGDHTVTGYTAPDFSGAAKA